VKEKGREMGSAVESAAGSVNRRCGARSRFRWSRCLMTPSLSAATSRGPGHLLQGTQHQCRSGLDPCALGILVAETSILPEKRVARTSLVLILSRRWT
jgi:hypothetical protein